jgi:uncharacterized protein YcbK (DUF882 family)
MNSPFNDFIGTERIVNEKECPGLDVSFENTLLDPEQVENESIYTDAEQEYEQFVDEYDYNIWEFESSLEFEEKEYQPGDKVFFPSGEFLLVIDKNTGEEQEHWDSPGSKNPLLDTSGTNQEKYLSKNFMVKEFTLNKQTEARIDVKLVETLQKIRDNIGRTINITSGYRSYLYNKNLYAGYVRSWEERKSKGEKVGTKPKWTKTSRHLSGSAVDFNVNEMNGIDLAKRVIDILGSGIYGIGLGSNFIHLDVFRKAFAVWQYSNVSSASVREIESYYKSLESPGLVHANKPKEKTDAAFSLGKDPVRLNNYYQEKLGWGKHIYQINDLLLPFSGNQNASLGEEAFTQAVSVWQRSQGFSAKDADGVIGPQTWELIRLKLGLGGAEPNPSELIKSSLETKVLKKIKVYDSLIERIGNSKKIDPNIIRAIIAAESGGDPNKKSSANYKGLMQAARDDSQYNPEVSIETGTQKIKNFKERYLTPRLSAFGIDASKIENVVFLKLLLASYNAGHITVLKALQYANEESNWSKWLEPEYYKRALLFSGGYAQYKPCSIRTSINEIEKAVEEYKKIRNTPIEKRQDPAHWSESMNIINPTMRCWIETKYKNTPSYLDKFLRYYQYFHTNPLAHELRNSVPYGNHNNSNCSEELYEDEKMDEEEENIYLRGESFVASEYERVNQQEFYPTHELTDTNAYEANEPEEHKEHDQFDEGEYTGISDNITEMCEYETYDNESDNVGQAENPETEGLYLSDEEVYEAETDERFFNHEFDVPAEKGTTDYLNTGAVEKRTLKTGVFIPAGYKKEDKVDLIVYFHGLYDYGNKINGIEYYWKNYSNIRACLVESRRNAILLAPTLTSDPQQSSIVFGKVNGFDNYITECFKELKSRNYVAAAAEPQRIILAGHSAGGSVLRRILGGKNQLLDKVIECWGFDCLYNYGWESLKISVPFYHYWAFTGGGCISSPGIRGENLQKTRGFKNMGPRQRVGHQGIIEYAWRNEINKRAWFNPVQSILVPETGEDENPFGYETPSVTSGSGSGFQFRTIRLQLSDTPILLVSASDRNKLSEVKEAPSLFLKRIVEMALGKDAAAQWFNNFTRITFLGRELQSDQYVHVELARHLKTVESELASRYGGIHADPRIAGDFLLGSENEPLAGSRAVSATATYSYHMFGLAIDVNYIQSPFIQNKERRGYNASTKKSFIKPNGVNTMNEVLSHACSLSGIDRAVFKYGLSYDQYDWMNKLLVSYLTLVDAGNESKLSALLTNTTGSDWKSSSIEEARKKIQADLDKLALSVDRWGYRELFKKKGFLNISREFVNGVKLDWGGARYGDMMHFDMRTVGVGIKIANAINEYIRLKRKEAQEKFQELHG